MENWQIFELKVTELLNNKFNCSGFTFTSTGGSDSTSSDIAVYYKENYLKSIEVKLCPAQSGQIVILPENDKFILSNKSIYKNNPYTCEILSHMNKNFKKYNKVSTSGIPIDLDKSIFFKWIKFHYTNNKNSDFIIAGKLDSSKENIEYINFINLADMANHFTITCPYRKKRSGTNELPIKYESLFLNEFRKVADECNFKLLNSYWDTSSKKKNKLFVEINRPLTPSEKYLFFEEITSYLSYKGSLENKYIYEVKKRSNTNNPNIVYTLNLTYTNPNLYGLDDLANYLNSKR